MSTWVNVSHHNKNNVYAIPPELVPKRTEVKGLSSKSYSYGQITENSSTGAWWRVSSSLLAFKLGWTILMCPQTIGDTGQLATVFSNSFTDLLHRITSGLSVNLTITWFCILKNSILRCCLLQYSKNVAVFTKLILDIYSNLRTSWVMIYLLFRMMNFTYILFHLSIAPSFKGAF